jgi:hypothetical protein
MNANRILHVAARVAVRLQRPLRAKRTVDALGSLLTPLGSDAEAQAMANELRDAGSCLTRALTVAARLPGAEVVIGAPPTRGGPLAAHAWVERSGVRIETVGEELSVSEVIVRLR